MKVVYNRLFYNVVDKYFVSNATSVELRRVDGWGVNPSIHCKNE